MTRRGPSSGRRACASRRGSAPPRRSSRGRSSTASVANPRSRGGPASGCGVEWLAVAAVAESVDAVASKAIVLRGMWVRVPPAACPPRRPAGAGARRDLTLPQRVPLEKRALAADTPVLVTAEARPLPRRTRRAISPVSLIGLALVGLVVVWLVVNLVKTPSRLLRGLPDRDHERLHLRPRRARLHARLRDPRADQLRPRRRLHARRHVRRHLRDRLRARGRARPTSGRS